MEMKIKSIMVALFLCAGVYAQNADQALVDSLLTLFTNRYDMSVDSMVYVPDSNYVSVDELIEALEKALSYTKEDIDLTLPYISSPAQKLRDMADKLEQKERDIEGLYKLLFRAKVYYDKNSY